MRRILALFISLALTLVTSAQTVMDVQAPNLVGINEQFSVTFVITGENAPSDFQWSPGEEFQLVWGPQRGSSSSVTIVNGTRTKSSQTTYTYVLMPRKTGKFQIQPAVATVKGDKISSRTQNIEVVTDGAVQGQQRQAQGQSLQSGRSESANIGALSGEDLYLRLIFNKTDVMVGESISVSLKLYQRVNIAGIDEVRFPTFNGFWSQETYSPSNIEFKRESVGDKIYNTAVLRSWNLIPQQSGDIRIDPAELVCLVNVMTNRPSTGSIFDSFFQDDYQTVRKRVTTDPVNIKVRSLPSAAPVSFAGGVGQFKINVELTRDSLLVHDAASLMVTVTGSGNVSLLAPPKINFPPDFEVYEVKTSDVQAGKRFEFPFIPRSYGNFTIDSVEYSYFDISGHKYVTLRSDPILVKVGKNAGSGDESGGAQITHSITRKDVRDVGSDIRFIKTEVPPFYAVGSFFVGSTGFWIVAFALTLLAVVCYYASKSLAKRRADVVGTKNRRATKMARKRLSQAGVYLNGNLYGAFYEELHKTLLGFVSDKLAMDAFEMSKENIAERLGVEGVPDALAKEFVSILDACEFARYSPSAGHDAMNLHYESAVSVISMIDESMKKRPHLSSVAAALIVMLMIVPIGADAAGGSYTDSLWVAGVQAYSDGLWSVAAGDWDAIRSAGVESPDLYYNLGNACFKEDRLARAILNYERALKLDPSHSDARFNLEYANSQIQDKIESVPEFFLEVWGRKMCWLLPSGVWAALFLVLLAITLFMLLLFLLGHTSGRRKSGFFVGLAALFFAAICLDFAFWQRSDYRKEDKAIVMTAVTAVKSSPGNDSAKDLFILHEGTKVILLDEVGDWYNIQLSDGRQGWISSFDLEKI